jgi:hypothetical protein
MSKKRKRTAPALKAAVSKTLEFNPDYSQVKRDLRRIGLLAGTFILILVVLSFFQDQLLTLVAR